ncbi:hypothetical protein RM704_30610 [Streptomyces sp. DSM 3412]|uniref:Uncharacterized protein n=1 Tax=Streptomyces gottesmaniae TaxID=3075518 RepID=A0ABU2Z5B0_9ACTN|nr:hypothetical protein [Streptomyces sp. DSM 3412]MDT0571760.1 hypothetical protein [Streptomyces sp. DSM 3412]
MDATSATAMLATPAAAALRPRHPTVDMTTAAPHHSFVCSAVSSTAGSARRTQVDRHDATHRVNR